MTDGVPGLVYERRDHIAYVTIDRTDHANSLHGSMREAMRRIWREIREDGWIRCTVVTGAGDRFFCTGADLDAVAATGGVSVGRGPLSEELVWSPRQNRVWKPTVAAVNGIVAGAGLHLVVDADIVVASESAVFLDTHVSVGMVGGVENVGLAKRLPLGSALRMTLCGRGYRMPARRAYELGLVDELVPPDRLMDAANEIAHQIAANSPEAVQLSMQAVWASLDMGYGPAQEFGWALARSHWSHPDFLEGPRAFVEHRPPEWDGPA